jgi:hypothetical protein
MKNGNSNCPIYQGDSLLLSLELSMNISVSFETEQ